MQADSAKIFGIGLSKTGTTSLARALEILGYKTKDYLGITRYIAGDLSSINLKVIDENDAFTDTPIPSFYKELDARYPNSKFILTTRNMDDWLKSCKKQFTKRMAEKENEATGQLHTDLYGCFEFDPEKFANGYKRFVDGVLNYFKDRPRDLLVMDLCDGEKWEPLCDFLNKPVPDIPFPVTNVSAIQWMDIQTIVSLAKQAGKEIKSLYMQDFRARPNSQESMTAPWFQKRAYILLAKFHRQVPLERDRQLRKATKVSLKIILTGLKKMNPSIPVISPANADIPFAERMNWSHLWLIDPLDGAEEFVNHKGTFTVNIALIEGGKPVWGVIYNPLNDTVYYAKGARGCYKIEGDKRPQKLVTPEVATYDNKPVLLSGNRNIPEDVRKDISDKHMICESITTNCATALCLVAEGEAAMHVNLDPTMEWKTAAAHAVVRSLGKHIRVYNTGQELTYNKENMVNDGFIAE
jgi:3'(2'),5'-bisphosphate nucleotidase